MVYIASRGLSADRVLGMNLSLLLFCIPHCRARRVGSLALGRKFLANYMYCVASYRDCILSDAAAGQKCGSRLAENWGISDINIISFLSRSVADNAMKISATYLFPGYGHSQFAYSHA
jgi:hypothetical protein